MYSHILVPVSFDADRNTDRALRVARLLAGDDGRITLSHVREAVPGYVAGYLPEGHMDRARQQMEAALDALAATVPGSDWTLAEGHPGRAITDHIRRHDIDCVVIASHRPGMQDLLVGSTATAVVRHAPCAVHVIR